MDYKEHITKTIDYIEQNLTNEIDLTTCAKTCGYSEYHFLRVFKEVTGLTPADYIRKRRLSEIAKRISSDAEPISEIAFLYGFNSKENFTRAFKTEHHILPTEYKFAQNSLKLYEPLSFEIKQFCVKPEIITIQSFSLTVYKSDENYPPNFWNKYNSKKLSYRLSGQKTCEDFGVNIWNHTEKRLDYFIGIQTENAIGDISGTQEIKIIGGLYAVFQTPKTNHANFINTINSTWEYINTVWLPQSCYKRTGNYELESYIEESRVFSEKIYIPIELK
ncbi:Multiple antibiotic resistance protein marA [Acholeplasma oculi]|uniref:Transcriptional regulator, AraC family n=1 Tax=Acholeplasma oculi TaxID=35623 RepID=A0A061AAC6_9MOLU|nr:helix-turn-helix domain-containing protein [Acholeplasma oculi]CDR30783.1 Transcriptional regulator, AraC family [Acholeplasma oculi]SKC34960.1 AraC family transcriptional regulator [Acholeplasma oculi]SUT89731.1 Multiple antibiotic resistance protein marA [Acholeplasma oculi]